MIKKIFTILNTAITVISDTVSAVIVVELISFLHLDTMIGNEMKFHNLLI